MYKRQVILAQHICHPKKQAQKVLVLFSPNILTVHLSHLDKSLFLLPYILRKTLDLICRLDIPVVYRQCFLDLVGQLLEEVVRQTGFHYLAPIRLICLAKHRLYGPIQL